MDSGHCKCPLQLGVQVSIFFFLCLLRLDLASSHSSYTLVSRCSIEGDFFIESLDQIKCEEWMANISKGSVTLVYSFFVTNWMTCVKCCTHFDPLV